MRSRLIVVALSDGERIQATGHVSIRADVQGGTTISGIELGPNDGGIPRGIVDEIRLALVGEPAGVDDAIIWPGAGPSRWSAFVDGIEDPEHAFLDADGAQYRVTDEFGGNPYHAEVRETNGGLWAYRDDESGYRRSTRNTSASCAWN